jgi:hypothetical protein
MSAPRIVEALTAEIIHSEEFRTALREVVSEMLAAPRPEAVEMVPPSVFARERSLNAATVRKMAKDGRIDAVRIGKRQWRVRRDSPIRPIRREERAAVSGRELAIERARQLAAKLGLAGGSR